MAKILKITTTAGARKHQFDVSHIQDVANVEVDDFRLRDFSSFTSSGLYTREEIQNFIDDPTALVPTKSPTSDHPNATGFEFGAPPFSRSGYFKVLTQANLDSGDIPIANALKANASTAATRWLNIPLSEDNYGSKRTAETYPTLQVEITTTSGSKNITVKGVRLQSPNSNGGSLDIERQPYRRIGIKGILTSGLEVVVDTKIPVTVVDNAYRFRTIRILKAGRGFADANGARFTFPRGTWAQLDASFRTQAFKRNNAVNITLAGVTAAKAVNLSEERFDEEMEAWLNGTPGNYTNTDRPPSFWTMQEDE